MLEQDVPDTWAERKKRENGGVVKPDSGWMLVAIGALCVLLVTVLTTSGGMIGALPFSLPVIISAMFLGYAAMLVPAVLFVFYNYAVLGSNATRANKPALTATGLTIVVVGILTSWFHLYSWKNGSEPVISWLSMNCGMATLTAALYVRSLRRKTPNSLVLTHIMLFAWFFSYAFPFSGEGL